MNKKQQIIHELNEIFNRWQELLTDLSEEQVMEPLLPSDVDSERCCCPHMGMAAGFSGASGSCLAITLYPTTRGGGRLIGPDPNEDVDRTNAYLFEASKDKPWTTVYADWKAQFEHFLELTRQIPEKDLLEPGQYAWMGDYPLSASTMGSLDHHLEHFDTLTAWLQDDGR